MSAENQIAPIERYISLLQCLVELTHLTSAYLCRWDSATSQSVIVAEYVGEEANYFEQQSDFGIPYYESPDHVIGGWISDAEVESKQINFYNLPATDPDRVTYLSYGARSIFCIRIVVNNMMWGYIELWESRYNHTFNLEQQAVYKYAMQQLTAYIEQCP